MKTIYATLLPRHDRSVTLLIGTVCAWALLTCLGPAVFAIDGQVQIHDPSTIMQCDGKYYTYGTGGTCLVSEDGWTWQRGETPLRRGMASDMTVRNSTVPKANA